MKNTLKMLMVLVAVSLMAGMFVPALAEETVSPTEQAPQAPVVVLTQSPSMTPAAAATPAPAEETAEEATAAPTEEATEAPVEEATAAPAEETTAAPTEEATEAPAEEATEAPAETEMPVATDVPVVTEEPTEAPVEFTGSVEIRLDNEGDIYFGDTIVLRAVVTDANTDYEIRWEVLEGSEWIEIEGEDEETYEFVVTEENCDKEYRVVLITEA